MKKSSLLLFSAVCVFWATGCSSQKKGKKPVSKKAKPQPKKEKPKAREKIAQREARPVEAKPKKKPKPCIVEGKKAEGKREFKKAMARYKKGCRKEKVAVCCYAQGELFLRERFNFDKLRFRKGIKPLRRACELEYYKACVELAQALAAEASERRIMAVEAGIKSGAGDPKLSPDIIKMKKEALKLAKHVCKNKEAKGCYVASYLYKEKKSSGGMEDEALYKKYRKMACKLKFKRACK